VWSVTLSPVPMSLASTPWSASTCSWVFAAVLAESGARRVTVSRTVALALWPAGSVAV
jgi:hypothetical protein